MISFWFKSSQKSQSKTTFAHKIKLELYIVYDVNQQSDCVNHGPIKQSLLKSNINENLHKKVINDYVDKKNNILL